MNRRDFIVAAAAYAVSGVMRNAYADDVVKPQTPEKSKTREVKWKDTRHGTYLTAYHAFTPKYLDEAKRLASDLSLSLVVVDVKTDDGEVFVETDHQFAKRRGVRVKMKTGVDSFVRAMHDQGVRVLGRVVVFKDPILGKDPAHAVLNSGGGIWTGEGNWANPFDDDVHAYNYAVATSALAQGLDGIQFDYIRCPAGKNRSSVVFPKRGERTTFDAITAFLSGARAKLGKQELSMDCFGELILHRNGSDTIIGQDLAAAGKHIDVVSPMVYPSHFYPGNFGFKDPGAHPYDVINKSVGKTRAFLADAGSATAVRPWLQCFALRTPSFGANYIAEQLRAAQDAGVQEVLWWNAGCDYSTIKRSLKRA